MMRIRHMISAILLASFVLVPCTYTGVFAEGIVNPAYEFYFQQLDDNQQAMYHVLLAAPAETAEHTPPQPTT